MNVPPFCSDVQPFALEGQVAESYSVKRRRGDISEKGSEERAEDDRRKRRRKRKGGRKTRLLKNRLTVIKKDKLCLTLR